MTPISVFSDPYFCVLNDPVVMLDPLGLIRIVSGALGMVGHGAMIVGIGFSDAATDGLAAVPTAALIADQGMGFAKSVGTLFSGFNDDPCTEKIADNMPGSLGGLIGAPLGRKAQAVGDIIDVTANVMVSAYLPSDAQALNIIESTVEAWGSESNDLSIVASNNNP